MGAAKVIFVLMFVLFVCLLSAYDLDGVVATGQSLSVGARGYRGPPHYSSSRKNFKLFLGSKENKWPLSPMDSEFKLVALIEPIRRIYRGYPRCYPKNICGTTGHAAMASQMSVVSVHTVVGEAGQDFKAIKKGARDAGNVGRAYKASLFEVRTIKNLAQKDGKIYGVGAITLTHGESDANSKTYKNDVLKLYENYVGDIRNITGQKEDPVLIASQQHSNFGRAGGRISESTQATWIIQNDAPGRIFCSGPKYQYAYWKDGIHLTSASYDKMGRKYGEVYNEVVVKMNKDWRPLQPISATVANNRTVNVSFHVPHLPLVWDHSMPHPAAKPQWRKGKGFELFVFNSNCSSNNSYSSNNDSNRDSICSGSSSDWDALEISRVKINGSSVLIVALQDLPSAHIMVGYAASWQPKRPKGTFQWGLLKDSDPVQANYAVSFEMDVLTPANE